MGPKSAKRNETKHQLEERLDSLSKWLERWTALVVLGLLVEVASEATRERTGHPVRFSNLAGEVLIMIGVAGELWVEVRNRLFSDKLRELTGSIIAASERSIAELNAETEKLRKENNETALLLSYRSVGDMPAFENAMREFSGTKYAIEFLHDSNETARLQWQVNGVLKSAGWVPIRHPFHRVRMNMQPGVFIKTVARGGYSKSAAQEGALPRSKAGEALADWLDDNRIATLTAVVAGDDVPGTLIIAVGPKPETIEEYNQIRAEYRRRRISK
jgi:hypothetical protein